MKDRARNTTEEPASVMARGRRPNTQGWLEEKQILDGIASSPVEYCQVGRELH